MGPDGKNSVQKGASKLPIFILAGVEVLVSLGAGFLARSAIADPRIGSALGFCIWFAGGLITMNSIVLLFKLDSAIQREIRGTVAEQSAEIRGILSVFNAYHSVTQSDFRKYRDEVLDAALGKFAALNRGEAEVEGDEYYDLLTDKVTKAKIIHAVSCRPLRVYTDDNREKNWAQANALAAERGCDIVRLFILEPTDLMSPDARQLMKRLMTESAIQVYVVWRESVDRQVLPRLLGGGFSIYDNDVVFWDRSYLEREISAHSSGPVRPRATVFCKPHNAVAEYTSIFKGLERQVAFSAKTNRAESYDQMIREADKYLTRDHGNPDILMAADTPDDPRASEWRALKAEIA